MPHTDHNARHPECHINAAHIHYDPDGAHHYPQPDHEPVTVEQLDRLLGAYKHARHHYGRQSEQKHAALEEYGDALRRASADVYEQHVGVARRDRPARTA